MNIILLIIVVIAIPLMTFYIFKMIKIKETERKNQEETRRVTNEKIIRPEKKLHEEEKKRWEDEYWKHQRGGQ